MTSMPAAWPICPPAPPGPGASIAIAAPGQVSGQFDLVVADVPCSGSGTWRRTPDAKWRLTEADLARLVTLQARILDRTAAMVGPGGTLAYMTCSLLRAENQSQTEAFLQRNPDFEPVEQRLFTPLDASGRILSFAICGAVNG